MSRDYDELLARLEADESQANLERSIELLGVTIERAVEALMAAATLADLTVNSPDAAVAYAAREFMRLLRLVPTDIGDR